MKSILVTGGSGFIARHCLAPMAQAGFAVHALSLPGQEVAVPGVTWHHHNLVVPGQSAAIIDRLKPDLLLHFAWCTAHGKFWTASENLPWLQSSIELLHSFYELGGTRAVVAGSCAEYSWDRGVCSEATTVLAPTSLYGVCKNALRAVLESYAAQNHLSWAWGRIFFVYGPHEAPTRLVPYVIRNLLQGEAAHCTSRELARDFLHVEDVAAAFTQLILSDVRGAVNVCSGAATPVRNIAETIGGMTGGEHLLHFDVEDTSQAPLIAGYNERLVREAGWSPKYDLRSGLTQTIEWWRRKLGCTAHA